MATFSHFVRSWMARMPRLSTFELGVGLLLTDAFLPGSPCCDQSFISVLPVAHPLHLPRSHVKKSWKICMSDGNVHSISIRVEQVFQDGVEVQVHS
ncbi:hypothetical protein FB451DRAFT_1307047, partial [Mycena latifolia]